MVLVVCFVGGMLYYAMNVLWPRQSQLLFTGPDPITKGLYSEMIPLGTISMFLGPCLCYPILIYAQSLPLWWYSSALGSVMNGGSCSYL
jgi:hypothetical protein